MCDAPHGSVGHGLVVGGDGGAHSGELISRESESGVSGKVTKESKHGDSACANSELKVRLTAEETYSA